MMLILIVNQRCIITTTGNFFVDRGNSLKDPASKAYAQVFAPYHGWAIRKAVAAGMYALPTKAQLLSKLNEDGESSISWNFYFIISTSTEIYIYFCFLLVHHSVFVLWYASNVYFGSSDSHFSSNYG